MASDLSNYLTAQLQASGLPQSGSAGEELTTIGKQLEQLRLANDSIAQQAAALVAPVTAGGFGGGGGAMNVAGNAFGGGLGLSPLISGLLGLFGGGDANTSPLPLAPYTRPQGLHVDAGFSDASAGGVFTVDTAQGGAPRALTGAAPAQITIQVQAMDSRSFLDHSQDIAMAVRQAMLETTVLNDVIREV